ncbi:MAG: hypothetical protein ABSE73_31600, partial [Planctomycetota bacterium]
LVHKNAHYPTKTRIIRIKALGGSFERKLFPPEDEAGLVPRGEELQIEVVVDERHVPEASPDNLLIFKSARATETPIELTPMGGALFKGTLAKALEDMEMTVRVGDARSDPYKIVVLARPEVDVGASGDCIYYTYPDYIHEPPLPPEHFGGLSALQGSTARLSFIPSKALASARLERSDGTVFNFVKTKTETRALPAKEDAKAVTETVEWWELPKLAIDKNASFHLNLTDVAGLTNGQPPVEYPIEARPDLPPTIKLVKPSRDLTVTPVAKVNVTFQARDDWGLRTVWLVYRLQTEAQGESSAVAGEAKRIERDVPHEKSPPPVAFTWDLSALNVKPGDQIVFWMEADDYCPMTRNLPVSRVRHDAEAPAPPPDTQTAQKYYPRSSDVKLTVISREEKILELLAEVERLYQQILHAKENQEELKGKVRLLLEEIERLKGE